MLGGGGGGARVCSHDESRMCRDELDQIMEYSAKMKENLLYRSLFNTTELYSHIQPSPAGHSSTKAPDHFIIIIIIIYYYYCMACHWALEKQPAKADHTSQAGFDSEI